MSDGRVIEGYKEDYLSAGPNVYWKVFVRDNGSLEHFEIYQQQGDQKVSVVDYAPGVIRVIPVRVLI